MARKSRRKRPCCICRKWFLPDVRQIGRQKACGPICQKELHRRQCAEYNRKNRADSKNNYLAKKIEKAATQTSPESIEVKQRLTKPVLPIEIIAAEYGIKSAIIVQYLVFQVIDYTNNRVRGFP